MQNDISTTSQREESESLGRPSVLDFLYYDSRRVFSFLAQLEGDGHLQQFTRSKGGKRLKKEMSSEDVRANAIVASGRIQGSTELTTDLSDGYSGVYDPIWANARAFLDKIGEAKLLGSSLDSAAIGQLVIAKGFLKVDDLRLFKDIWKTPTIQRQFKGNLSGGRKPSNMSAAQKEAAKAEQDGKDIFADLIPVLPHSIHARLITDAPETPSLVWCTLAEEYLVTSATDIMLTHGEIMPGDWSIVGILTAYPEFSTPGLDRQFDENDLGMMDSLVGQLAKMIAPVIRVTLGRPAAAYAVTPLLIFREVAGAT